MRIVIISGRSGSGKSTALHVMEDAGFYCIDNLPAGLLPPLVENILQAKEQPEGIAISIDARNTSEDLEKLPALIEEIQSWKVQCEIVYLDAKESTLISRFGETRRKHPLSSGNIDLRKAIAMERELLSPIAALASLNINTTNMNLYELREQIKSRVSGHTTPGLALLFQSFGFKRGVPVDSDFVFDVRCLPNPYWHNELRPYNGLDTPVQNFLSEQEQVTQMLKDIVEYLDKWLPDFTNNSRTYMTVSIGCTGGQHRSVYICEQLQRHFTDLFDNVQIKHRELERDH